MESLDIEVELISLKSQLFFVLGKVFKTSIEFMLSKLFSAFSDTGGTALLLIPPSAPAKP